MMEEMIKESKKDKARIEELQQEVDSRGSAAGSQAEEEEDLECTTRGPTGEETYVKGQGRGPEQGSWSAVYSFQGRRYQWKWVEATKFWHYLLLRQPERSVAETVKGRKRKGKV